ncbi:unnamed protein product [Acanthosepion pharaonis]|uniref:Helitron helicase-like domain-containing protein n=1 Tax=Acanthosepion pharaonis TaxID=158019 RepID=A0A812B5Y8_ACAPH|nr:unnamed protein product [Sepia pharaonis]
MSLSGKEKTGGGNRGRGLFAAFQSISTEASPHRKATRNAADAAATYILQSEETTAEKTARNAAKSAATSIRRSQESMAEKSARQASEAAATTTFDQVYHGIGSLLPKTATDSSFLQIYFIADYNQQTDTRMGIIPENDTGQDNHPRSDIIMNLQQMLHETNSYVRSFKYALKNNTSSDFIIVFDADKRLQGEHERRYNAPANNEVSVIVSGNQHNRRDIVIESHGSGLRRISETYRSYNALQYPLLFFFGEDGYHYGILQNVSTLKTVSCRSFYAYLLMVHEGAYNHLHRCREIFHHSWLLRWNPKDSVTSDGISPSCAATLAFPSVMLYEITLIHAI